MKSINWLIVTGLGLAISLMIPLSAHGFYRQDSHSPTANQHTFFDSGIHLACPHGPSGEPVCGSGSVASPAPFRFSTKYQDGEHDYPYYGYRYFNPSTGRWLSRDPAGEPAGINRYSFVGNDPNSHCDPLGLWEAEVHRGKTSEWARELGVAAGKADIIGISDNDIDRLFDPFPPFTELKWSWHFNRSVAGGDSRLDHKQAMVQTAEKFCTKDVDNPRKAAEYLGYALHPLQDWVAHGDFNRRSEAPSLKVPWYELPWYGHNFGAGGYFQAKYPDSPGLDANGPNGRATFDVLHWNHLSNGDQVGWTEFHSGVARFKLTEGLTKELLTCFQIYVRDHARPCGQCWAAFLTGSPRQ